MRPHGFSFCCCIAFELAQPVLDLLSAGNTAGALDRSVYYEAGCHHQTMLHDFGYVFNFGYRRLDPIIVQQILDLPQEEFCTVQNIEEELPKPARIFNSITCAFCGETASEARARVKDGKLACIPCAGI